MKELELINIHRKLGGKIIDFAGFAMPIQYFGIKSEHLHVRNSVGLFDVSHMGQIFIEGDGSFDFLQFLTSNDLSKLKVGQAQYTYLPNERTWFVVHFMIHNKHRHFSKTHIHLANIE